jgi:putative transposase
MLDSGARWQKLGATRLPSHDYSSAGAYFVTVCSHQRLTIFESPGIRKVIELAWDDIPNHFAHVSVDAFVVMPNHIHGLLIIVDNVAHPVAPQHAEALRSQAPLSVIVRSFKAAVTREVRLQELWDGGRLWQPNFIDRVVCNERELDRIREYIAHNPIAWQFDQENLIASLMTNTFDSGAGSKTWTPRRSASAC